MFASPWFAGLLALFSWWFSTGIILLVVRKADQSTAISRGAIVALSVPLLALGVGGLVLSAGTLSIANVYVGFLSVLLIWGWVELSFLSGLITGPERRTCPDDLQGWPRFVRAWHTLSYHELLLLGGLLLATVATTGAENTIGFWAYLVLFIARISAKLNLFFGVPHINTEFVPAPLEHLKSYFRQGRVTVAFALGVTLLALGTIYFAQGFYFAETAETKVGFALLSILTALATLEHLLMVIRLQDAKLWRWMLPAPQTTTKTGRSHEF